MIVFSFIFLPFFIADGNLDLEWQSKINLSFCDNGALSVAYLLRSSLPSQKNFLSKDFEMKTLNNFVLKSF